jgi:hypothetical protein
VDLDLVVSQDLAVDSEDRDLAVDLVDLDLDVHHMDTDKNQDATNQLRLQGQPQLQHVLLVCHLPSLVLAVLVLQHALQDKPVTLPHLHAQLVQPQFLLALLLHPKQPRTAHAELQLAPLDKPAMPHLHAQLVQPQLWHALLLHPKQRPTAHAELLLAPLDKFVTPLLTLAPPQLQPQ